MMLKGLYNNSCSLIRMDGQLSNSLIPKADTRERATELLFLFITVFNWLWWSTVCNIGWAAFFKYSVGKGFIPSYEDFISQCLLCLASASVSMMWPKWRCPCGSGPYGSLAVWPVILPSIHVCFCHRSHKLSVVKKLTLLLCGKYSAVASVSK